MMQEANQSAFHAAAATVITAAERELSKFEKRPLTSPTSALDGLRQHLPSRTDKAALPIDAGRQADNQKERTGHVLGQLAVRDRNKFKN